MFLILRVNIFTSFSGSKYCLKLFSELFSASNVDSIQVNYETFLKTSTVHVSTKSSLEFYQNISFILRKKQLCTGLTVEFVEVLHLAIFLIDNLLVIRLKRITEKKRASRFKSKSDFLGISVNNLREHKN